MCGKACKLYEASEELLALHPDRVVQGALRTLHASRSHADFLANLSTLVNVCGAGTISQKVLYIVT